MNYDTIYLTNMTLIVSVYTYIYINLIVKSRLNPLLKSTSTEQ